MPLHLFSSFSRTKYEKQFRDYAKFLQQLATIGRHLFQMMLVQQESRCLFMHRRCHGQQQRDGEGRGQQLDKEGQQRYDEVHAAMVESYDQLDSEVFYGQCLGFYLCEPCQLLAKVFCSIQLGMGQAMSVSR